MEGNDVSAIFHALSLIGFLKLSPEASSVLPATTVYTIHTLPFLGRHNLRW